MSFKGLTKRRTIRPHTIYLNNVEELRCLELMRMNGMKFSTLIRALINDTYIRVTTFKPIGSPLAMPFDDDSPRAFGNGGRQRKSSIDPSEPYNPMFDPPRRDEPDPFIPENSRETEEYYDAMRKGKIWKRGVAFEELEPARGAEGVSKEEQEPCQESDPPSDKTS